MKTGQLVGSMKKKLYPFRSPFCPPKVNRFIFWLEQGSEIKDSSAQLKKLGKEQGATLNRLNRSNKSKTRYKVVTPAAPSPSLTPKALQTVAAQQLQPHLLSTSWHEMRGLPLLEKVTRLKENLQVQITGGFQKSIWVPTLYHSQQIPLTQNPPVL